MKKVLIFSLSYYPGFIGGAEVAIKEITDRLDEGDFEFHLVCPRWDSQFPEISKEGNVIVHRIGFCKRNPSISDLRSFPLHLYKIIFQFHAPLVAWRLHKKHKFDVLWAMMAHATGVAAFIFKKFVPNVLYVLSLQEGDPPLQIEKKMRIFCGMFRRSFVVADHIQVISNFLGQWAKHMGATAPITRIPNGVDVLRFSAKYHESDVASLRALFPRTNGERYVVTMSRLVHKNGIDVVISAMQELPKNVHFLILGIGPDEQKLRGLAGALGVSERVHFVGHVDMADIPKYLHIADVFTRPSRSEGMGNSFIEAMAAGVPVVATAEGGIVDFLFDDEYNIGKQMTGLLARTDDATELAQKIQRFFDDDALRSVCIANAQAMVAHGYDWNEIAKRMSAEVF